jgi:calcium-dependent protein kinase
VNELKILLKMDHPNILKIYEVYEDEIYFHMVTAMYKGGELFDIVGQRDQYSEA